MQLNNQAPEPVHRGDGMFLDLHSIFLTIQGEGPFSGRPSVFVRLAGCNLQCPGCDTEYTQGRTWMSIENILLSIADASCTSPVNLVVITGGEPLRQNIAQLCKLLVISGYTVQIESNGVFKVSSELELLIMTGKVNLVVSPKTSRISDSVAKLAIAFKYVLRAGEINHIDGLPTKALGHKAAPQVARPHAGYTGPIYINPMDEQDPEKNAANLSAVKASAMEFGYTLGLQIHKLIEVA